MRALVTGSHGLIGGAVAASFEAEGIEVTRLVRSGPGGPGTAHWDPAAGTIDAAALEGHDFVVHLAGPSIGGKRWTPAYKRELTASRVNGTALLARTLAGLDRPPSVLASASAVGFYGDRGDEELSEASPGGGGFLAGLVRSWEVAAAPAAEAGIRVVLLRSGVVLDSEGGALAPMLLPFKLGLGGRLGTGRQWFSWIALDDEVGAIRHLLLEESVQGPVNLTSPNPVTNAEFTKALGKVLGRPTVVPVPTAILTARFGRELVDEMILTGQRVLPGVLAASGYRFRYPEIGSALARAINQLA